MGPMNCGLIITGVQDMLFTQGAIGCTPHKILAIKCPSGLSDILIKDSIHICLNYSSLESSHKMIDSHHTASSLTTITFVLHLYYKQPKVVQRVLRFFFPSLRLDYSTSYSVYSEFCKLEKFRRK
jgi:hypothetical protein